MKNAVLFFLLTLSVQILRAQFNFIPPPDLVVSCGYDISPESLNDYTRSELGNIVFKESDRKKIYTTDILCEAFCKADKISGYPGPTIANPGEILAPNVICNYYKKLYDTLHPEKKYDLVWGLSGFVSGVQSPEIKLEVIDKRQCGKGKILRNFKLIQNNTILTSVTQTIWVVTCDPFDESDIIWPPKIIVINDCARIDSLQRPKLVARQSSLNPCSLISIEYTDEAKVGDSVTCLKIDRKWVVIDWCQYDPFLFPGEGRWEFIQHLEVKDLIQPELELEQQECTEFSSFNNYTVKFKIGMRDNCTVTDFIKAEYYIDIGNDGKGIFNGYDLHVGPLTKRDQQAGIKPIYSLNPFALDSFDVFIPNGKYPLGKHKMHYRIMDGCGNIRFKELIFEVLPSEQPVLQCLPNTTVLMPDNGILNLFVKDFIISATDNCSRNLFYSFDPNTIKPILTIDCREFESQGFPAEIRKKQTIYVRDVAGNQSTCETFIVINDDKRVCVNANKIISAQFQTLSNKPIHEIAVQLNGKSGSLRNLNTACSNTYTQAYERKEYPYALVAAKSDRNKFGVDVRDVWMIRKDLLDFPYLSPAARLAADVNGSGTMTAADIAEMDKLILGSVKDYSKRSVYTWNFIGDSLNRDLSNIAQDNVNVTGFKYGDVNGSSLSFCDEQEIIRNPCLKLQFDNITLEKGKQYKINVSSVVLDHVAAMQMDIRYDPSSVRISNVVIENNSFGGLNYIHANDLSLLLMHNLDEGEILPKETLFSIELEALKNTETKSIFKITDGITRSIGYNANGDPRNICLNDISSKTQDEDFLASLQIFPNPSSSNVDIRLPKNMENTTLELFSMDGKQLVQKIFNQNCTIQYNEFNGPGFYYVRCTYKGNSVTKAVIIKSKD